MYSTENTIPQLVHKSLAVKQMFASVANKALARGLTQDEAIFAGLNSLPTTKIEPRKAKILVQEELPVANVEKASLASSKVVQSVSVDKDNRFVFVFDDGTKITTNSLKMPENINQSVTVVSGDSSDTQTSLEDLKASGEPTGFANRLESTLSFDDAERLLTITPTGATFKVYLAGKAYDKTTDTIPLANIDGLHFVYYSSIDQELKVSQVFSKDIITKHALVCIIYWNSVLQKAVYVADERHGIQMDGATHLYLHLTNGAVYRNGLGLNNIIADGNASLDSHAKLGIYDGAIADEDIDISITNNLPQQLSTIAKLPLYYRLDENLWYKKEASEYPLLLPNTISQTNSFTRPAYNKVTGTTWSIAEVPNNEFVLVHILASNDILNPVISVVGGTYKTKSEAKDASLVELVEMQGLPFAEIVRVATVIYQSSNSYTNFPKARIISYDGSATYIDWRYAKVNTLSGSTVSTDPFKNDWERDPSYTYVEGSKIDRITYLSGNYEQYYYDGDNIDYIDYVKTTGIYRKTYTYSGSNVTSILYTVL